MAHSQYARQADACPEGTAFYKCAVGPFIGCCSTDPCDTGVCADVDDCTSNSMAGGQGSSTSPGEQTTTLTVTISQVIASLTMTTTISDLMTSVVTEAATATATITQAAPSLSSLPSNSSDVPSSLSRAGFPPVSSHRFTGSTLTSNPVSSLHATAATTASTTIHISSKVTSSMRQTSSATAVPPNTQSPHIPTVIGGILGGFSLLGLLALLLLCCCLRKKSKYSFRMKRKTQDDKEDKKRAELLRRAEEAALERQTFLGTAITTGALSPVRVGTTDVGPSPYPRNSTAVPPQHWI